MIDFEELTEIVLRLGAMPFFPGDDYARLGIVEEIGDMVHSLDEARWLVKRALKLYNKWPGLLELRAVLSSRVTPRDGFEAVSGSFGPEGIIPDERPDVSRLAAPERKRLEPGERVSNDPELDAMVGRLARSQRLYRAAPVNPDEIEELKRIQVAHALHEATRVILAQSDAKAEASRTEDKPKPPEGEKP